MAVTFDFRIDGPDSQGLGPLSQVYKWVARASFLLTAE